MCSACSFRARHRRNVLLDKACCVCVGGGGAILAVLCCAVLCFEVGQSSPGSCTVCINLFEWEAAVYVSVACGVQPWFAPAPHPSGGQGFF